MELAGVRFAHPNGTSDILAGIDLVLEPGETMALVGLTGSGKTTLLQLVPRLYDVTAGAVRIDGVDVRDVTRADLRTAVSIAFEDPILFSASVRENVLLGTDLAGPEADDLVREALDVARARVRVRPARRTGHGDRRGRAEPVGRSAAAHRPGTRDRGAAPGPAARRPAVGPRRHHRGCRDRPAARDAHRDHHAGGRAPPVDRRAGGPGGGARGRPHHRDRPARRPARRTHPHYRYVLTALAALDQTDADELAEVRP